MRKNKNTEQGARYIVRGLFKTAAQDDFDEGEISGTEYATDISVEFDAPTIDGLTEKIADWLEIEDVENGAERDACGEIGRVDFAREEGADGEIFDETLRDEWRAGEVDLWYAVYTAQIEKIERVSSLKAEA